MAKKKKQVGGARPGAGRKQKHKTPTKVVSVTIPEHILAAIESYAERKEIPRSEAVTKALALLTKTAV